MWTKSMKVINRTTELFSALLLFIMVILVFIQIVSRVIMSSSFPWTEEVARFMMIWITFLGASVAFQYGAHIGVEALVDRLPAIVRKFFVIVVMLICLSFFVLLIVYGYELASGAFVKTSPALQIPMGYIYYIIPVSGVLMSLNLLDVTGKTLFSKKEK
ncbi:TRAP transporter small permease [Lysinibacillus sp. LZ02]|uniref:TRAP transporter small permease n=1 Tax=Lysinibacillus sp. LZ02 TaxID=3420668 RepID=UPI003D3666C7